MTHSHQGRPPRRPHRRHRSAGAAVIGVALLVGGGGGVFLDPSSAVAADQPFPVWVDDLQAEARARGISDATVRLLDDVAPISRVIELDRRQPEGRLTLQEYLDRVINNARVAQGRRLLRENATLLREIGAEYGVQPRFIVALWGLETSYGQNTGGFPVLATLAHDGRRSDFFRAELLSALEILDQGHIAPARMQGSWAGAMGQSQFMPSSFQRFAVDRDGDGRKDIWTTRADVFASAANYLSNVGWDDALTWGRAVQVPGGLDRSLIDLDVVKPITEWAALGVRRRDGGALPDATVDASLIQPDGPGTAAWLVYDNFRATLRWNRSTYFATSVGLLSDAIGGCTDAPAGLSCAF